MAAMGLITAETLPDAVLQGVGAFSAIFGVAGAVFDTTLAFADLGRHC